MQNDEIIELFIPVPKFDKRSFRIAVRILGSLLTYFPVWSALLVWLCSNGYYAMFALLLFYLVSGAVNAKIRQRFAPLTQQEHNYSSYDLAAWMLAYYFPEQVRHHD